MQVPIDFPRDRADAVAKAIVSCGFQVALAFWHDAPDERVPDAAPVVALAQHVVQPRRAAALMAGDIPHLPIVFTGMGAEVGPYVRPGRTPCLACVAAHRRDADPTWPLVAAQLLGRSVADVDPSIACEAGIVAARQISEGERHAGTADGALADPARRLAASDIDGSTGRTQTAAADLSQEPGGLSIPLSSCPRQRQRSRGPRDSDIRESSLFVDLLECRGV